MVLKLIILLIMYLWLCDAAFYNDRFRTSNRQNNNARVMRRPTTCNPPKFYNGVLIPLRNGKMMKFECKKGFIREGERYVHCINGRWDVDVLPICIKAGCSPIAKVDNGQISYINKNTIAILLCDPYYEAVGSAKSFCNGLVWDRAIGSCKEASNAPLLECNFESESICGYIHDSENDFDFIRSSGYNNRTMTLETGPHADHTIGKPLEGHFMVIKTNSERGNKKARLISQSYNLTQSKNICIRFFYHMYGQSVGKLRIYQKPLSLDFKDVLINDDSEDDEDNEDKSKYLIFSISGTQGNAWIKGGAFMRVLNENFEIVIEAVTGHTMMCDIAIDDVSILLDDDCIDEDQATTPQMIEEDDNIFDVQSCVGRCLKDNVTKIKVVNATLLCNCNFDCLTDLTCCPDFIDVCSELEPSTVATTSTTTTTPKIIVATTSTTTAKPTPKPTPKTTVASTIITTSTTPKTTPKTTVASTITTTSTTLKTTLKTTPKKTVATTTKTIVTEKKTTDFTTLDPYRFITDKNSDVDEFIVDHDDDEEYDDSIETIKPQEIAKKSSSSSSSVSSSSSTSTLKTTTFSHSITLILISLGFVLTITVIAFVLIKRYKSSTNPLNYKQNRRKVNTKNVTEEFSEVRYLTEDECLDFNLATTESCE